MRGKYQRILGSEEGQSDFWPSFTDMLTTIVLVILLVFVSVIAEPGPIPGPIPGSGSESGPEPGPGPGPGPIPGSGSESGPEPIPVAEPEAEAEPEPGTEPKQETEVIRGKSQTIIDALKLKFEQNNIKVKLDENTGDITFDSNVLFDYNSSQLKSEAMVQLKQFIPSYMEVINEYKESIEEIIVEGHTDDSGSYLYNLKLSQDRAFNVVYYILGEGFGEFAHKDLFRDYVTANGKSFSKPIYVDYDSGIIDAQASRRVTFNFRLKEEKFEGTSTKEDEAIDKQ